MYIKYGFRNVSSALCGVGHGGAERRAWCRSAGRKTFSAGRKTIVQHIFNKQVVCVGENSKLTEAEKQQQHQLARELQSHGLDCAIPAN